LAFKSVHRKRNLSHEIAASIREAIFQGDYPEGSAIPPEPELADQFGVSRAVIRDATRILEARGMIEIIQGKGMFVTPDANEAFAEVLLNALKKRGAATADVEGVIRYLLPEACGMLIAQENEKSLDEVAKAITAYQTLRLKGTEGAKLTVAYRNVVSLIFLLSGNRVMGLIGPALLKLTPSRIADEGEERFSDLFLTLLGSVNSYTARERIRELLRSDSQGGLLAQASELRQEELLLP